VSRALEAVKKIEMRNKEIITERRQAADNSFKPRSQSFDKENKTPVVRRAAPLPLPDNRYIVDRKYLPPRQFKI
jgi:hypothetical protein